jgi:hypothetical protein
MMKMRLIAWIGGYCAIFAAISAYAEWGPWQTIGDGKVAVSFSQVDQNTCTWQIKNTGSHTLSVFDFSYTYTPNENPHTQKTDKDTLPYPLKPGAVVGGWTVYSASTPRCPDTLVTLKLERRN